jgi:hypothetical protein
MAFAHFALHLLPTLAVVVLALIIVRAVSVRVTWRRSTIRHLDDGGSAVRPMPPLDLSAPREAPGPRERPAAPPLRSHAA